MTRSLMILSVTLSIAAAAVGADADYLRDVKPLLAEKCTSCHGPLKQEAGLRLDAAHMIHKGSDSGPVAVPNAAAESLLLTRVGAATADERMPPEGEGAPLNAKQIAILSRWIESGMAAPDDESVLESPREHWAYQPVVRPAVPAIVHGSNTNPVDAFLEQEQDPAGVVPYTTADRGTQLRRLSFDLIGLPPTVAELQAFLADDSGTAYLREVDRLLASPLYGERWARHWMDVWRYSDWDGYRNELRGSQRHIWRWRDWIIESLNADKGYDHMILEMLAGDEIAPEDPDVLRATGFLARNYHNRNRDIWMDAAVEHTAKAFLGMTLNCARCHDHKFDPIEQEEYFAFRAIFEPYRVRTDRLPGEVDPNVDGLPRVYDADLDAQTYLYVGGNEKQADKEHPLGPAAPQAIELPFEIAAVSLPRGAYFPALAPHYQRDELAAAERALAAAQKKHQQVAAKGAKASLTARQRSTLAVAAAEARLDSLRARWAADSMKFHEVAKKKPARFKTLATKAAAAERRLQFIQAKVDRFEKQTAFKQASTSQKGDAQKRQLAIQAARQQLNAANRQFADSRKAMAESNANYTPVCEQYPRTSTGRRLALARWITDPKNPLTARVAVNHVWLRHFGEPLVDEVFDFGLRSSRPVHAELLDWLAAELMGSGWSMKHLHRLIVTSQAYRRASSGDSAVTAKNRSIDPDNRHYWRTNVRRLDAEVVRDRLLYVAGQLDLTRGGPDIDFQQGESVFRRSIYFRHAYEKQMTMLVMFDAPSPTECYRRSESIIPQQALALANSSLGVSLARELAARLSHTLGPSDDDSAEFVEQAYLHVLSRAPTAEERKLCRDFLRQQSQRLAESDKLTPFGGTVEAATPPSDDPHQRARENLVHVLMNHNDFVTVR